MEPHFTKEFQQWLPAPRQEVFSFFSNEMNLESLTPPWLQFQVLCKSSPALTKGTLIDYQLKIRGFPIRWRTLIQEWQPNERFVDIQLKGPYALWEHTHEFRDEGDGTRVIDSLRFRVPGGRIGRSVVGGWVERDVDAIFAFRREALTRLFARR